MAFNQNMHKPSIDATRNDASNAPKQPNPGAAGSSSTASSCNDLLMCIPHLFSGISSDTLTHLCQFLNQNPAIFNAVLNGSVPFVPIQNHAPLGNTESLFPQIANPWHAPANSNAPAVTPMPAGTGQVYNYSSSFPGVNSAGAIQPQPANINPGPLHAPYSYRPANLGDPSRSPNINRSRSRTPEPYHCSPSTPGDDVSSDSSPNHPSSSPSKRKHLRLTFTKLKRGSRSDVRSSELHKEGFSTGPDTDLTDVDSSEFDSDDSSLPVGSRYQTKKKRNETGKGSSNQFCFRDRRRSHCCLRGFRKLFNNAAAFDVTLRAGKEEFACHKALLMASSDYFYTMFTSGLSEQDKDEVSINGIEPDILRIIIKYFYKGTCELTKTNVEDIFMAADFFQLPDLKTGCEQYMLDYLEESNYLTAFFFAERLNCEILQEGALKSIMKDFSVVANSAEFLKLSHVQVSQLLEYDENTMKEEKIFLAIMKWLQHNVEERSEYIYDVFSKIRYTLMSRFSLSDTVLKSALLTGVPKMKAILDDVLQYKLMCERWMEVDLVLEPRAHDKSERVIIHTWGYKAESLELDNFEMYNLSKRSYPSSYLTRGDKRRLKLDMMPDSMKNSVILTCTDHFYLAGGWRRQSSSNKFYSWERTADGDSYSFHELKDMLHYRDQFSMAQVDSLIYVIGGRDSTSLALYGDKKTLNSVESYNPDTDSWTAVKQPLPRGLQNTCAIGFCGNLYVFGGKYNQMVWEHVPATATTTYMLCPKLLLFMSDQAYCLTSATGEWRTLPSMVTPRAWAGCTIFNKKIYVIGGGQEIPIEQEKKQTKITPLSSVEIYDPSSDTWEQGPELPVPLCGAGVVKYKGTIYVLGGRFENGDSNSVYRLDPATNTWKQDVDLNAISLNQTKPELAQLCSYGVLEFTPSSETSAYDYSESVQNESDRDYTDDYNSDNPPSDAGSF